MSSNRFEIVERNMVDLKKNELCILSSIIFLTLFFGFYPEPLLGTVDTSISNLIEKYNSDINFYLAQTNK